VHSVCALSCKAGEVYIEARRRQQRALDVYLPLFVCFSSGSSSSFAFPRSWYLCFFFSSQFIWAWSWILQFWKRFNSASLFFFILPVLFLFSFLLFSFSSPSLLFPSILSPSLLLHVHSSPGFFSSVCCVILFLSSGIFLVSLSTLRLPLLSCVYLRLLSSLSIFFSPPLVLLISSAFIRLKKALWC